MRLVLLATAALLLSACGPRALAVRDPQPGNTAALQGKTFDKVYLVPFDQSDVVLNGAHGDDEATKTANKAKWFDHLAVGVQQELNKRLKGVRAVYAGNTGPALQAASEKYEVTVETADSVPADALVVKGRYVESREVSGASRAWVGGWAGKSFTRAEIKVFKGDEQIYACTLDGKYLGGGFSWGYETLGANERLGHLVAQLLWHIRDGRPIVAED